MIYGIWTFCAALLAFIISAVTGKFLIPYLRKLHFGQTILEEGPKWHKGKQGTPTMGGIMFIVAIVVVTMISTVIYAFTGADLVNSFFADIPRECMFIFCGLGLAVANGFIGFIDDYIKVVKKRNLGLTAPQKLILQFLVAAAFLAVLAIAGYGTTTTIPFVGKVDLGFFYYIIAAVAIVGIVNSVNLTDGIDGLDGSVTFFACVAFMLIACVKSYLGITAMSAASAGACLGFLVWNFHPAKVFMGDTGSLFLGGLVAGVLIGVVFHGQLAVGLFDLRVRRRFGYPQHLVIITFFLCHIHSPLQPLPSRSFSAETLSGADAPAPPRGELRPRRETCPHCQKLAL